MGRQAVKKAKSKMPANLFDKADSYWIAKLKADGLQKCLKYYATSREYVPNLTREKTIELLRKIWGSRGPRSGRWTEKQFIDCTGISGRELDQKKKDSKAAKQQQREEDEEKEEEHEEEEEWKMEPEPETPKSEPDQPKPEIPKPKSKKPEQGQKVSKTPKPKPNADRSGPETLKPQTDPPATGQLRTTPLKTTPVRIGSSGTGPSNTGPLMTNLSATDTLMTDPPVTNRVQPKPPSGNLPGGPREPAAPLLPITGTQEQQGTPETPAGPVPPATVPTQSQSDPSKNNTNPDVASNPGGEGFSGATPPVKEAPLNKRPDLSIPENQELLKSRIQNIINGFSYQKLEIQPGRNKPRGLRLARYRRVVVTDDGNQISWAMPSADGKDIAKAREVLFRGRGPIWDQNSCAIDSCIVAGMFLDVGSTLADLEDETRKISNISKSFRWMVQEKEWPTASRGENIRVRNEFWKALADSQKEEGKNPWEIGTPLPAAAVWRACTEGFGQFTYKYQTKTQCLSCSKESLTPGRTDNEVQLCPPKGVKNQTMENSLQSYFGGDTVKKTCKSCGQTGGSYQRKIICGDLPLRLAVFPPGTGEGVARGSLTGHTATANFECETESGRYVVSYRWLGGIYYRSDHFRVFWSDRERFGADTSRISAYDGKCASGRIVSGLDFGDLDERVPHAWGKEGQIVLFYEREIASPPEVWRFASAVTAAGGIHSAMEAGGIANLDPEDEVSARNGNYRPRHHRGGFLDMKVEAIEDLDVRREVQQLMSYCPLSSVRDCYLAHLAHPSDSKAAIRTLKEARVQLDTQTQDISLYEICPDLEKAQLVRKAVVVLPLAATHGGYRMVNGCCADLFEKEQFRNKDYEGKFSELVRAVLVRIAVLKLPSVDPVVVAEHFANIIQAKINGYINQRRFEELFDTLLVRLVELGLPGVDLGVVNLSLIEASTRAKLRGLSTQGKLHHLALVLMHTVARQLPGAPLQMIRDCFYEDLVKDKDILSLESPTMQDGLFKRVLVGLVIPQLPGVTSALVHECLDALFAKEWFMRLAPERKLAALIKAVMVELVRCRLPDADSRFVHFDLLHLEKEERFKDKTPKEQLEELVTVVGHAMEQRGGGHGGADPDRAKSDPPRDSEDVNMWGDETDHPRRKRRLSNADQYNEDLIRRSESESHVDYEQWKRRKKVNEQTRDGQAGDEKTGDEKIGDENTGDQRTGDEKAGDQETGDQEMGDERTKDQKIRTEETGNQKTGDQEMGDEETGDQGAARIVTGSKVGESVQTVSSAVGSTTEDAGAADRFAGFALPANASRRDCISQ
jgi:hypothetical protein